MANSFDFNPDLNEINEPVKEDKLLKPQINQVNTVAVNSDRKVTLSNLVNITEQHTIDDAKVRDEINELTDILDNSIHQMSIREYEDKNKRT